MFPCRASIARDITVRPWLAMGAGDDPARAATPGSDAAARAGTAQRVLIVEDEALVAMDMEIALADAGYDVTGTVDTAADAIAAALRLEPDIVLMDITLREGDGIDAARRIMAQGKLRLIFVSGNSDPRTLAAARALNPAGFIRKPFASRDLAQQVAAVLAGGDAG